MRIKDILRDKGADVVTVGGSATVHDAVMRLNKHNVGSLVVTADNDIVVGIITERDILREVAERCDKIVDRLVIDVMSRDVIIGVPEDDLGYVIGIMTKNRIRHLPVMDDSGLAGIVSIGDVVRAHLQNAVYENRMLRDYIHGVKNSTPAG
jgi:CBS domain-containing protein